MFLCAYSHRQFTVGQSSAVVKILSDLSVSGDYLSSSPIAGGKAISISTIPSPSDNLKISAFYYVVSTVG
ncbi:unnamed protein product [Camellia sinensis]